MFSYPNHDWREDTIKNQESTKVSKIYLKPTQFGKIVFIELYTLFVGEQTLLSLFSY